MIELALPAFAALLLLAAPASATTTVNLVGRDLRHRGALFPLEQATLRIELAGPAAATTWELRFRNDGSSEAEGELNVPLRPGCRVSGYAMDVAGRLREGVVVGRERARRAYEEIVSRKVDPGILETTDSGFSTRVYPIPASGSKTVRVDLSELRPPGEWRPPLPAASEVEARWTLVCHDASHPRLTGLDAAWQREHGAWVARGSASLTRLAALRVTPEGEFPRWAATPGEGILRVIGSLPATPPAETRPKPGQVELWWDGSLAGRNRDLKTVTGSLDHLFRWIGHGELHLRVFRSTAMPVEHFPIREGRCAELRTRLLAEPAEGMARFDVLTHPSPGALPLVVSEGLTPLPKHLSGLAGPARWSLLDPSGRGGATLGHAIIRSGGEVRSPADEDWKQLEGPAFQPPAGDDWSWRRTRAGWVLAGSIPAAELPKLAPVVARSPVARPLWAAERFHSMHAAGASPAERIAFAKQERVLSESTAFIVLDGIEDYVRYRIEPPESALRESWLAGVAKADKTAADSLARWTGEWRAWREKLDENPPDYATLLGRAVDASSSRWARHVGPGEKQIPADDMIRLVRMQAELKELPSAAATDRPAELARLKQLAAIHATWSKLDRQMAARVGTIQVTVGGYVRRPGPVEVPAEATLWGAVHEAGGPNEFGAINRTELFRGGRRFIRDLRTPEGRTFPLEDNDSVNVPQKMWLGNGGGQPGEKPPFESSAEKELLSATIRPGPWDPERPYVKVLSQLIESGADWRPVHRAQSAVYGWRADYHLDVLELLERRGLNADALRIAAGVAQLDHDSPELLRRSARALARLGDHETSGILFHRIADLAPDEPVSWVDLARWHHARGDADAAIACYASVTEHPWDSRWRPAWTTAMIELNGLLHRHGAELAGERIAPARQAPLAADLRVVLDWDAARVNVDLWVDEPLGSIVGWGHQRSPTGGGISTNAIAGYGPEEYILRQALPGTYTIRAKFHGDWNEEALSTVTVEATIIHDFGRPTERRRVISLRLPEKARSTLGQVEWKLPE